MTAATGLWSLVAILGLEQVRSRQPITWRALAWGLDGQRR